MNASDFADRLAALERVFPPRASCAECYPHNSHLPHVCQRDTCDCAETPSPATASSQQSVNDGRFVERSRAADAGSESPDLESIDV